MPIFSPTSTALATRKRYEPIPGEPGVWSTSYIGSRPSDKTAPAAAEGELCPVAYLVESDAETLIKPHFHMADQFQLVVNGGGTFGPETLSAPSFHYSSAYTTYGPIRAFDEGLGYLTLRNGWDAGARWMPEHRDLWRAAKRPRHEVVAHPVATSGIPLAQLRASEQYAMLESDNGLAGVLYRLPPGGSAVGPVPALGRGQYWVVMEGSVEHGGEVLELNSCIWVNPDESAYAPVAGAGGAEVIMLQFPKHAD